MILEKLAESIKKKERFKQMKEEEESHKKVAFGANIDFYRHTWKEIKLKW